MRRAVLLAVLAACTHRAPIDDDDGADAATGYPPPRTDVVPALGSEATLELATWNIENFPDSSATPGLVADLIASLDLDVIVVEEIASETAWQELLGRLRDYDGVLSAHRYTETEYQKIGVLYRRSLVTAGAPELLFQQDGFAFPRPPLALTITVDQETIELVGVHLKAGVEQADIDRRTDALVALDGYLRSQIDGGGENEIVMLGDYNQKIVADTDRAVMAPLLDARDRYTVRTEPRAVAGDASFLGFGGVFIDHITTTAALDVQPKWSVGRVEVPALNAMVPDYKIRISDHLPVVLIVPR